MDKATKAREARLRREAAAWGEILVKARVRDPEAPGYGLYNPIEDTAGNRLPGAVARASRYCTMTLDEVENFLTRKAQPARSGTSTESTAAGTDSPTAPAAERIRYGMEELTESRRLAFKASFAERGRRRARTLAAALQDKRPLVPIRTTFA